MTTVNWDMTEIAREQQADLRRSAQQYWRRAESRATARPDQTVTSDAGPLAWVHTPSGWQLTGTYLPGPASRAR